jgi:hypothetical protein
MSQAERVLREWTKFVGKRRLTAFERALSDPELISLKQEIAKLDLRIADLEERAHKGESRGAWHHVKVFARELNKALTNDPVNVDKALELSAGLDQCAQQGLDDFKLWDEIERLIELRRKMVDTERKYEEFNKLLIPASALARLFDDLLYAIEAVIPERTTQRALLHEVRVRLDGEQRRATALVPIELPAAYVEAHPSTHETTDDQTDAVEDQ